MTHGMKKSDEAIVAEKSANKGERSLAEPMERRASPEGKPGGQNTCWTQSRGSVTQAADRIRQFVNQRLVVNT